jgi:hypothetical protein
MQQGKYCVFSSGIRFLSRQWLAASPAILDIEMNLHVKLCSELSPAADRD